RRLIAAGAGVEPHQVNELVKQFDAMADMMKSLAGKGIRERMRMVQEIQKGAMSNPAGLLTKKKLGTGKRLSAKERAVNRKLRERDMRRNKRKHKGQ
ncbi:MAG: signal recognition particle protein, partial [Pirellulales bacterium]